VVVVTVIAREEPTGEGRNYGYRLQVDEVLSGAVPAGPIAVRITAESPELLSLPTGTGLWVVTEHRGEAFRYQPGDRVVAILANAGDPVWQLVRGIPLAERERVVAIIAAAE